MKLLLLVDSFKLIPENDADIALFQHWQGCQENEDYETVVLINSVEQFMYVEFVKDENKVNNK